MDFYLLKNEHSLQVYQMKFSKCQFSKCQFSKCQYSKCQFSKCQVSKCQVSNCQVSKCQISKCQISKCQVSKQQFNKKFILKFEQIQQIQNKCSSSIFLQQLFAKTFNVLIIFSHSLFGCHLFVQLPFVCLFVCLFVHHLFHFLVYS